MIPKIITQTNKEVTNEATFTGYWEVKNNPKTTGRLGHISHAKKKNFDFFIAEQDWDIYNSKLIFLAKRSLPSLNHLSNLKNFCEGRDSVYTKWGQKILSKSFSDLATIWTSKILLFQTIKKHTSAPYIIWRDCVYNPNFHKIKQTNINNKIIMNKQSFPKTLFGGLLSMENLNFIKTIKHKIGASVIKIPYNMVDDVCDIYINCLKHIDSTFEIYDEEIVLSYMCNTHRDLFHII